MTATSAPGSAGALASLRRGRAAPHAGDAPLLTGSMAFARVLTIVVAALLVVASIGGILFGARGLYQPDPWIQVVFLGQDVLSLIVAVPLLLGSAWAARQGSLRGLLLWCGALFYVVYSYYYYLVSAQFGALFLVHVAIVTASAYALLALLLRLDMSAIAARFDPRFRARAVGGFLAVSAGLFAVAWIVDAVRRAATGEPLPDVQRWVYVGDLTMALPAGVLVGVGLWRRAAWALALAGIVLVKVLTLMLTLITNSAIMAARGDAVTIGGTVPYAAVLVLAAAATVHYLRAAR